MTVLGIVVIGRNEGRRLVRCLDSIGIAQEIVYVDSGSSDGSVAAARARQAQVVELDVSLPFTAARARNAGRAALSSECELVQFIDGDCILQPGWIAVGSMALANEPSLAAVFGRRREMRPDASRYNWMCDVEWSVPPGRVRYFGGDVMLRASALDQAGGYPSEMIAGEEPDVSIRLRALGWRIACLPAEMTLHDAAITRFGQWWRRSIRSGHAYAELGARHAGAAGADYRRRLRGVLAWGGALPVGFLAMISAGWVISGSFFFGAAALVGLLLFQFCRLTVRALGQHSPLNALTIGAFLVLTKPAQAIGVTRYWRNRLMETRGPIIEYKTESA